MHVGVIAPLYRKIPPTGHAGVERIIDQLANGLLERGHKVTLFAASGSKFKGNLVTTWPREIRDISESLRGIVHADHLLKIFSRDRGIELWSNHFDNVALSFAPLLKAPMASTIHNGWNKEREVFFRDASKYTHLIAISKQQRTLYRGAKFTKTIYNGVDTDRHAFGKGGGGYFLWLGWISEKKGAGDAVQIARKAKVPLVIAGMIAKENRGYFETKIRPYLSKQIRYVGEVSLTEKVRLLRSAVGLLSPLRWEEPFGLVAVEAMSCGTPVLTTPRGAMPELVVHGKTGFLAKTPAGLTKYVRRIGELDRRTARQHAIEHFSLRRMVDEYERTYLGLLANA
ncbi:MAG: glycosyltransferase family 4 protein [bacterium]|nr:glycosyltransferase family 4 protein [bacterium]MDZ4248284.1 glycosyltransferase family 4 protein [Patescibacteria group bacterium]